MKVLLKNFHEFFTNFSNARSQKNEQQILSQFLTKINAVFEIIKMHHNIYLK